MSRRNGPRRRHGVDSDAVARDDALVEALSGRQPVDEPDEVASLLAAWCAAVDDVPAHSAPARPDPAGGAPAGAAGTGPPRGARPRRGRGGRRRPPRRAAVTAGTLLVLALAGFVGAEQATPGSPFWPLTRLVDHGRAHSLAAFDQADHRLDHAVEALDDGQLGVARREMAQVRQALAEVRPGDGRDRLAARLDSLQRRLAHTVDAARSAGPAGAEQPAGTPRPGDQQGEDGDEDGGPAVTASPTPQEDGASDEDGNAQGGDRSDQRGDGSGDPPGGPPTPPGATRQVPVPAPEPVAPTPLVDGARPRAGDAAPVPTAQAVPTAVSGTGDDQRSAAATLGSPPGTAVPDGSRGLG